MTSHRHSYSSFTDDLLSILSEQEMAVVRGQAPLATCSEVDLKSGLDLPSPSALDDARSPSVSSSILDREGALLHARLSYMDDESDSDDAHAQSMTIARAPALTGVMMDSSSSGRSSQDVEEQQQVLV